MSLEKTIMQELKIAMLNKNEAEMRTLRAIKAAILIEKTSSKDAEVLSQQKEIQLLNKLTKQRKESMQIYQEQQRNDLFEKEREELAIILRFLPKQMDPKEVQQKIAEIIQHVDAKSIADMGKVMAVATKELAGKADNKTISDIVKSVLPS